MCSLMKLVISKMRLTAFDYKFCSTFSSYPLLSDKIMHSPTGKARITFLLRALGKSIDTDKIRHNLPHWLFLTFLTLDGFLQKPDQRWPIRDQLKIYQTNYPCVTQEGVVSFMLWAKPKNNRNVDAYEWQVWWKFQSFPYRQSPIAKMTWFCEEHQWNYHEKYNCHYSSLGRLSQSVLYFLTCNSQ